MRRISVNLDEAQKFCYNIITDVSQNFAMGIKSLSGTQRDAILCGYLLARITDCIEDSTLLEVNKKSLLMDLFLSCFDNPQNIVSFQEQAKFIDINPSISMLLTHTGLVFLLFYSFPKKIQSILQQCISKMGKGMIGFVERYPNGIRIQTMEEYKEYCYYAAGTVGDMLTDLFYELSPFISKKRHDRLNQTCRQFAEVLQSVNILKDIVNDKNKQNNVFIPAELFKSYNLSQENISIPALADANFNVIQPLFDLTEKNIQDALLYIYQIPKFSYLTRFFCIYTLLNAIKLKKKLTLYNPLYGHHVDEVSIKKSTYLLRISWLSVFSNTLLRIFSKRI